MYTKHPEIIGIEIMLSMSGMSSNDLKNMSSMLDKVFELGYAKGYKRGYENKAVSEMMEME